METQKTHFPNSRVTTFQIRGKESEKDESELRETMKTEYQKKKNSPTKRQI